MTNPPRVDLGLTFDALEPPERLDVATWAERYRILAGASNEQGPYRLARTPYWREVMNALGPYNTIQQVSLMKAAQIGASELALNWQGYLMSPNCGEGGPCMLVFPQLDGARRFVKTRFDGMVRACPQLRGRVRGPNTGRQNTGSSWNLKRWPGGHLIVIGANSPASMREAPVRYMVIDEADEVPLSLGEQGDPLELLRARQTTFPGRKLFILSTPTVAGESRIEREYEAGDQSRYHVPCMRCGGMQTLDWERLRADDLDDLQPLSVWIECMHCNGRIDERDKPEIVTAGEWVAGLPERSGTHRSFQVSSLYSPMDWVSWATVLQKIRKAKGRPEARKALVNTVLGEPYAHSGDAPEYGHLLARREAYVPGEMPAAAIALTCGVDVQTNRLEALVCAWGERLEMWAVDYRIMMGDTADLDSAQSPWRQLEALLLTRFPVGGVDADAEIVATGLDSGFATATVYEWWRRQGRGRVWLLKGVEHSHQIVTRPRALTSTSRAKHGHGGIQTCTVGTSMAKTELFEHLRQPWPEGAVTPTGWRHYPFADWCDDEFFRQLTAERLQVETDRNGYERRRWVKVRDRNEVLDCHVYARAAAALANVDRLTAVHVGRAKIARIEPHRAKPKRADWKRPRWRR